ncbi:unnamed protein product, partial [Rotaria sp. Silwood1]
MVSQTCHIWNLYGPAATTIDCTFHLVHITADTDNISIERILLHHRCLILGSFLQSVVIPQGGELYVGGADFLSPYDVLLSLILRWLGAHVEDDVKFAEFQQILRFPSNLLNIERGVTTFGEANLAPLKLTKEGLCCLDEIHLGSHTNLGNWCTIMPATRLPPKVIVGSLTLITRKTASTENNCILLGIPAHQIPFVTSDDTSI